MDLAIQRSDNCRTEGSHWSAYN